MCRDLIHVCRKGKIDTWAINREGGMKKKKRELEHVHVNAEDDPHQCEKCIYLLLVSPFDVDFGLRQSDMT